MKSICLKLTTWKDLDIDFEECNDDFCIKLHEKRIAFNKFNGGISFSLFLTNDKNYDLSFINKLKRKELIKKDNQSTKIFNKKGII